MNTDEWKTILAYIALMNVQCLAQDQYTLTPCLKVARLAN
jgi:hypothetical protein